TTVRRGDQQAQAQDRAKKLFGFDDAAGVTGLTLHVPNGNFVLERHGTQQDPWEIEAPRRTPADSSAVTGLLHALLAARSSGQVEDKVGHDPNAAAPPPKDLRLFGLAPPVYVVTLSGTLDDRPHSETVLFGKKNSFDGSLYVQRPPGAEVLWTDGALAFELDQDLYKLRDKRPLPIQPEQVAELEVADARGPRFAIRRQTSGLFVSLPNAAPQRADAAQVETLLAALSGLRAKQVASEGTADSAILKTFGLDAPRFVVQVRQHDQPKVRLLFGSATLAGTQRHFVQREGDHPVLEMGSDWAWKKLSVPPDALRDVRLLPLTIADIAAIDIAQGEQRLQLRRDARDHDAWQLGSQGKLADAAKVSALLYKLTTLKPEGRRLDGPDGATLGSLGLLPPRRTVTLRDAQGQLLGALHLGNEVDGKVYV
ncbi:MAG: DUF4340 domain-containing protein, partial [Deltaproteobacteria bacterium]